MKVAMSNMWVTVQGMSRTASQTLLANHPNDLVEALLNYSIIGDGIANAFRPSKAPLEVTFPFYVSLAFANDCLKMLLTPVGLYLQINGSSATLELTKIIDLNLTPLMPVLKPIAKEYAGALPQYASFRDLTKQRLPGFIITYLTDSDIFGPIWDETLFLGIKLAFYTSWLLKDSAFIEYYYTSILAALFQKAVSQTGTQIESKQWWNEFEGGYQPLIRLAREHAQGVAVSVTPEPKNEQQAPAKSNTQERENPEQALHSAKSELSKLVGLGGVKDEVTKLTNFLTIQKERRRHGLKEANQTLHFVFTGNPGTGKTTVARIIGKILYGFGLLKSSKVVETDRSNLVGGYLGQTAIKTDEVITSALDGVLFIDEAYTLWEKTGQDSFGKETVNTLLKRMEDYRDRLTVIVAGYPALMDEFLKMNPGLSSRFTRFIRFDDYSIGDLCQIFLNFCQEAQFTVNSTCRVYMSLLFALAYKNRDEQFGNARFVRNLFEQVVVRNSQRLVSSMPQRIAKEHLMQLDPSDLMVGPLAGLDPKGINLDSLQWKMLCPKCQMPHSGGFLVLGRQVKCGRCGTPFQFNYFNPIV